MQLAISIETYIKLKFSIFTMQYKDTIICSVIPDKRIHWLLFKSRKNPRVFILFLLNFLVDKNTINDNTSTITLKNI